MEMENQELMKVVQTLQDIAKDLQDCGPEEWLSLRDCCEATKANIDLDLNSLLAGQVAPLLTYP
jgi:hypothetical protein